MIEIKRVAKDEIPEVHCCLARRTSPNTGVLPTLLERGGKVRMLEHTRNIIIISTDGQTIQTQR